MKLNLTDISCEFEAETIYFLATQIDEMKVLRDDVFDVEVEMSSCALVFKNVTPDPNLTAEDREELLETHDVLTPEILAINRVERLFDRAAGIGWRIERSGLNIEATIEFDANCFGLDSGHVDRVTKDGFSRNPEFYSDKIVATSTVDVEKKSVKLEVPRRNEATYHDVLDKKSHDAWIEREAKVLEDSDEGTKEAV